MAANRADVAKLRESLQAEESELVGELKFDPAELERQRWMKTRAEAGDAGDRPYATSIDHALVRGLPRILTRIGYTLRKSDLRTPG